MKIRDLGEFKRFNCPKVLIKRPIVISTIIWNAIMRGIIEILIVGKWESKFEAKVVRKQTPRFFSFKQSKQNCCLKGL